MTSSEQPSNQPQTGNWGIVSAMAIESQAVLKILKNSRKLSVPAGAAWQGTVSGRQVYLFQCGIGSESPARVLANCLNSFPVDKLLICGLSGSLNPDLKTGETFSCERVYWQASGEILNCSWRLDSNNLPSPAPLLLTCSSPLITKEEKQAAAQATGAWLVDMESFALVKLAHELHLPVGVLRSVCDDFQTSLPAEVSALLKADGNLNVKSLLCSFIKRPSMIHELLSMQKQSRAALNALSQSLQSLLDDSGV